MREGWKHVRLDEIANVTMGLSPKGETYNGQGIGLPLLNGPTEFGETYPNCTIFTTDSKRVCLAGDLIFCVRGSTTGRMNWADRVYSLGRGVCSISGTTKFDTIFIKHYLTYNLDKLLKITGGGTFPNLRTEDIKGFQIVLPKEYKKIASILSGYDDLIENNLKRIKILEEMAQQTYEEWFVRMRFPGYESATINPETGLPEGWEKVKISDVCTVSGGGTPSKNIDEYWLDGDINWYTPTDLTKNKSLVITDSELKTNSLGITKSSAKVLEPNSFIMTSRATIGIFALLDKPFSTNQGFINITPNNNHLKGYLLYNFMFRMDQLKGLATGTTFPELSKSKFKVLDIVRPSAKILLQFSEQFEIITKQVFNLTYQNQRLREVRDILLPRLMMGMVEV